MSWAIRAVVSELVSRLSEPALCGTEIVRVGLEEALREPKLVDPELFETAEVFFG